MKTTTIRFEDYVAEQIDLVAKITDRRPADVVRDALRSYIDQFVDDHPEVAEPRDRALRARLAEQKAQVLEEFGVSADDARSLES